MKTRLLGAAVLIALAVLFVPMFFSTKPPATGGDQSVSLAIPPAPDSDLKTKTMSLNPNAPVGAGTSNGAGVSGDRLATVDIGSQRPRDIGTDAAAPNAPSVNTGSGASPGQPVIPMQNQSSNHPSTLPKAEPRPAAPPATAPKATTPSPEKPPAPSATVAAQGSYTLNLSAYASASGAARLQKRVRALGYPVSSHLITHAGKSRTMVIAGPFETRTAAEAARLKITQSIPSVPAKLEQDASTQDSAAAPAKTAGSKPGGYAVQLAAVSSKADAEALRDKLRKAGFDGFVDSVRSGGQTLWRVRAGPQIQRSDAQRVHDQIKQKLHIDGNVVSVP